MKNNRYKESNVVIKLLYYTEYHYVQLNYSVLSQMHRIVTCHSRAGGDGAFLHGARHQGTPAGAGFGSPHTRSGQG